MIGMWSPTDKLADLLRGTALRGWAIAYVTYGTIAVIIIVFIPAALGKFPVFLVGSLFGSATWLLYCWAGVAYVLRRWERDGLIAPAFKRRMLATIAVSLAFGVFYMVCTLCFLVFSALNGSAMLQAVCGLSFIGINYLFRAICLPAIFKRSPFSPGSQTTILVAYFWLELLAELFVCLCISATDSAAVYAVMLVTEASLFVMAAFGASRVALLDASKAGRVTPYVTEDGETETPAATVVLSAVETPADEMASLSDRPRQETPSKLDTVASRVARRTIALRRHSQEIGRAHV